MAWTQFENAFKERIENNSFIKITLSGYRGKEQLKNIYIKKVSIKNQPKYSFTYRYKTRDIVKNFDFEETILELKQYFGTEAFTIINMFSLVFDEELSIDKQGKTSFKKRKASLNTLPDDAHNKVKQRKISGENQTYLHALEITDKTGKVYNSAQDKFKQINHYIEILSSVLKDLPAKETIHVADMGSGKGYLTFALYDYLNNNLHKKSAITGVEYRQDMVELCNNIARQANFDDLNFVQAAIANYEPSQLDVLIALHACDTATDDAIAKGIKNDASVIVVAPCCHKQIRKEIKNGAGNTSMDYLLKYGLFMERQAEMITDSIRCLILEYFGYQTKVVDFIADVHTPKNVMIIAQKKKNVTPQDLSTFEQKLKDVKTFWGIKQHYLEQILSV